VTAIGFAVAWAGYAIGIWGYCLLRDYNVTLPGLFKTTWPGSSSGTTPATSTAKAA
jgi:hypothetical protein